MGARGLLEALLEKLWKIYCDRVHYARQYAELVTAKGGRVVNDHIAWPIGLFGSTWDFSASSQARILASSHTECSRRIARRSAEFSSRAAASTSYSSRIMATAVRERRASLVWASTNFRRA